MKKTNNTNVIRKAILFARVSTARQEKEGLSLHQIQIPRAEDYAKTHDLEIIKVFAIGETGGQYKNRVKFNEMIEYVKKHKNVNDIIAFRVDRITRNWRDAVTIDKLRTDYGKTIHFVDDNLVLNENSRRNDLSNWDMKVLFARNQLEGIKENGSDSKYAQLEAGRLPWNPPYGYKRIGRANNSNIIIDPVKGKIAKEILERYSTGLYSELKLAKEINEEFGTTFVKGGIHVMLTSKFYIGTMLDKKSGKEYPHIYEHLISRELYERNQEVLGGHSNVRTRYYGTNATYKGLITCPICGCSVTPDFKTKKQKNGNVHHYKYYRCTNAKGLHTGKISCIEEKKLDAAIVELFKQLQMPEERKEEVRKVLAETAKSKNAYYVGRRGELNGRQKRLKAMQQRCMDLYLDPEGGITKDVYDENMQRYRDEIEQVEMELHNLENADQEYYITMGYVVALCENAGKLYEVAKPSEKCKILSLLVSNLSFDGEKLEITLKKPFRGLLGISESLVWQGWQDLNPRHAVLETAALPTELHP